MFKELETEFEKKQIEEEARRKEALDEIHRRNVSLDGRKIIEHARKHDELMDRIRSENKLRFR